MSRHEHFNLANPRRRVFYKYICVALGRSRQLIRLLDSAGNTVFDGLQTAEAFSKKFLKNFSTSIADCMITDALNCSTTISLFNASYCDTVAALLASSNSAAGPDGISGSLLRKMTPVLGQPVSIIIIPAVSSPGSIPSAMEGSLGGSRASASSSYRQVSLCLVFGKALKKIVRDQIIEVEDIRRVLHDFSKRH